jgi:hypothetical protein
MTTFQAGQVNIPDAANMACCGSIEVVQRVLDGKLKRKWRLPRPCCTQFTTRRSWEQGAGCSGQKG